MPTLDWAAASVLSTIKPLRYLLRGSAAAAASPPPPPPAAAPLAAEDELPFAAVGAAAAASPPPPPAPTFFSSSAWRFSICAVSLATSSFDFFPACCRVFLKASISCRAGRAEEGFRPLCACQMSSACMHTLHAHNIQRLHATARPQAFNNRQSQPTRLWRCSILPFVSAPPSPLPSLSSPLPGSSDLTGVGGADATGAAAAEEEEDLDDLDGLEDEEEAALGALGASCFSSAGGGGAGAGSACSSSGGLADAFTNPLSLRPCCWGDWGGGCEGGSMQQSIAQRPGGGAATDAVVGQGGRRRLLCTQTRQV
jgi:hypothetical protein